MRLALHSELCRAVTLLFADLWEDRDVLPYAYALCFLNPKLKTFLLLDPSPRTSFLVPRTSHLFPRTSFPAPLSSYLVPRTLFLLPYAYELCFVGVDLCVGPTLLSYLNKFCLGFGLYNPSQKFS